MNQKSNEKRADDEMSVNYNDRPDGYGFGPSESVDDKQPYEKERKRVPDMGHDEYGQRNQYGPVDQYNFRDMYERRWSRPGGYIEEEGEEDWRDWDKERFSNDDYSRMAGPDFRESSDHGGYPGVSGKTIGGGRWFNRDEYNEQRKFMGLGPKNYSRSDDRIYEEVCDTLMKSPDIDASEIGVRVENADVILEGKVDSRRTKRLAEYLIEDLPGVGDIRNELRVIR
jgi:hypothetical protein